MKKALHIIIMLVICSTAYAQNEIDSTYVGKSIFEVLPSKWNGDSGTVTVTQSAVVAEALQKHIENSTVKFNVGYRIRIYFSNVQNARWESENAVNKFKEKYDGYPVYRSFNNPNFQVTVGDFRTKSDALILLNLVKRDFPTAFIVREGKY